MLALRLHNNSPGDLDHERGNSCEPVIEASDISRAGYLELVAAGWRSECRIKATANPARVSWGAMRDEGEGGMKEGGCSLPSRHLTAD